MQKGRQAAPALSQHPPKQNPPPPPPLPSTLKPPAVALAYWRLPEDATMRDVILAIRADEACHSHVNHTFAELEPDAPNPFALDQDKSKP